MDDNNLNIPEERNVTIDELIARYIRTPEQRQKMLRVGWIHEVMMQLISARSEAGLTQKELGERMGKQQSAIARFERGDDLKISTLFDYLAALDLTPTGRIPVDSYSEAVRRIPGADEAAEVPDIPATSVLAAD